MSTVEELKAARDIARLKAQRDKARSAYENEEGSTQKPSLLRSAGAGAASSALSGIDFVGDIANWASEKMGKPIVKREDLDAGYEPSISEAMRGLLYGLTQEAGKKSKEIEKSVKTGEDRKADAAFTFANWALPYGKASKLDAIIGGTASGSEYLTEELTGQESEYAQLAGLIPAAGSFLKSLAVGGGNPDAYKQQDKESVADWFNNLFHDKDAAHANIRKNVGEERIGDIADLAEDAGVARAIEGVAKGTKLDSELQQIERARETQQAENLRGLFSEADPQLAQDASRGQLLSRMQEQRLKGEQDVEAAQAWQRDVTTQALTDPRTAALETTGDLRKSLEASAGKQEAQSLKMNRVVNDLKQAEAAVDSGKLPSEASEDFSKAYKTYEDELTTNLTRPAWKEFEETVDIPISGLAKGLGKWLETQAPAQIVKEFMNTPLMRDFAALEDAQAPKDLHYYISTLKKKAVNPNTPDELARLYTLASKSLDDYLKVAGDGDKYEAAKKATVRANQLLGGDHVQGMVQANLPETIGRALFKPQEEGAAVAKNLLPVLDDPDFANPKLIDSLEEYMLSRAADEGITDEFMLKYGEMLDVWRDYRPEFVRKFDEVVKQKGLVEAATTSSENLRKAETEQITESIKKVADEDIASAKRDTQRYTQAAKGSQLKEYMNAPKKTISKALAAEDPSAFKRLQNAFKTKEELESFEAETGNAIVDLFKRKGGLTKSPEEFSRIEGHIENLLGSKSEEAKRVFAQTRAMEQMQKMKNRASSAKYVAEPTKVAEDTAATLGAFAFMGTFNPRNSLLITGFVKRAIARKLHDTDSMQARQAMVDNFASQIMKDPMILVEFEKAAKTGFWRKSLNGLIDRLFNEKQIGLLTGSTAKATNEE